MKRVAVTVGLIIAFLLFPMTYALGQTVILEEHFDSPTALDNWEDLSDTGDQYSVTNEGHLRSEWPLNTTGISFLVYQGEGFSLPDSFEINYNCRMLHTPGSSSGSDHGKVTFHFYDKYNRVSTSWRQNAYNDFPFWIYINGVKTEYGLVGANAYNFDETQWHTVKVVKDGTTVSAYLRPNGLTDFVWMYTETISTLSQFPGGTIGLLGSDGIFEFDDLVVTVPGPPPALRGCIELYGDPLEKGIEVTLQQQGKPNLTTVTDSNGCYRFNDAVVGEKIKLEFDNSN